MTPTRRKGTFRSGTAADEGRASRGRGRLGCVELAGAAGSAALGIGCAKPILSGGCSAACAGHSEAGFGGSGNLGSGSVENSGTGLVSNVLPRGSTPGAIGTLDFGLLVAPKLGEG